MSLADRMDERAIKAERARKQLNKHREALRRKRESALLDADAHPKETQTEQKQPAASPASGPLDKPETASAEDAVPCEAPDTTDIFSADVLEPQKEADTAALFAVDDAAPRPEAPSDISVTEPAHFASELWSTDAQIDAFDFEPGVDTNIEQSRAPSYSAAEPATGLFDTTVQPQTTTNLYAPFPQRAKSMDNYAESFEASVFERDEDHAAASLFPSQEPDASGTPATMFDYAPDEVYEHDAVDDVYDYGAYAEEYPQAYVSEHDHPEACLDETEDPHELPLEEKDVHQALYPEERETSQGCLDIDTHQAYPELQDTHEQQLDTYADDKQDAHPEYYEHDTSYDDSLDASVRSIHEVDVLEPIPEIQESRYSLDEAKPPEPDTTEAPAESSDLLASQEYDAVDGVQNLSLLNEPPSSENEPLAVEYAADELQAQLTALQADHEALLSAHATLLAEHEQLQRHVSHTLEEQVSQLQHELAASRAMEAEYKKTLSVLEEERRQLQEQLQVPKTSVPDPGRSSRDRMHKRSATTSAAAPRLPPLSEQEPQVMLPRRQPTNMPRMRPNPDMTPNQQHRRQMSLSMLRARLAGDADDETFAPSLPTRKLSIVHNDKQASSSVQRSVSTAHTQSHQFSQDDALLFCGSCKGDLLIV